MSAGPESPPVVLIFAGSDPCGAGIQADIEACANAGCHPAPVITAVTAQNTKRLIRWQAMDAALVAAQAEAVLDEIPVAAIKTGMLASPALAAVVRTVAQRLAGIPLVVDPVLATDAGNALNNGSAAADIYGALLAHASVVTPNTLELRALAPRASTPEQAALELCASGAAWVLVTGTHDDTEEIHHTLYDGNGPVARYRYARLPGRYHGSGCTLASALAARLARGQKAPQAAEAALQYTYETLTHGYRPGDGQWLPDRYRGRRGS